MPNDLVFDLWTNEERKWFSAIGAIIGFVIVAFLVVLLVFSAKRERAERRKMAPILSNTSIFLGMGDSLLADPRPPTAGGDSFLLGKIVVIDSGSRELDRISFQYGIFEDSEWYTNLTEILAYQVEDVGTVAWITYDDVVVGNYTCGTAACKITCEVTLLHVKRGQERIVTKSKFTGGDPPEEISYMPNSIPEKAFGSHPWEDIAKWLVSLPRRNLDGSISTIDLSPVQMTEGNLLESPVAPQAMGREPVYVRTEPLVEEDTTTALFEAIKSGDAKRVKRVSEKKPQLLLNRDPVSGDLPLHTAAQSGQVEIVRYLLSHDAVRRRINSVNNAGQTALTQARNRGHDRVIRLLEQYGISDQKTNRVSPFVGLEGGKTQTGN